MTVARALCVGALLCAASRLPAQTAASPATRDASDELIVSVITFGPGDVLFERFGHNALWLHDARNGVDIAYNWGLYDFAQPGFIGRFLTGDTKYWMAGEDANAMIANYHRVGRRITVQRLALRPEQALALRDELRWNALEEHKYYRYDYFRDNCSTRLRDALDRALGGVIKAQASGTTPLSYRRETLRLMHGDPPMQAAMDVALGRPADAPLTVWQSFFIPMRLRDGLRPLRVASLNGGTVPLVSEERMIEPPAGVRPAVETAALPPLVGRYLLIGVLLATAVIGLRIMMLTRRGAAWGLAMFGATWSLVCGLIGTILLLAWFTTRHVFWAWNENVLLFVPLSLALMLLAPASMLSRRFVRPARMLGAVVALLGIVALLLALTPGGQESGALVALVLPVHLALAWSLALPRETLGPSAASLRR